MDIHVTARRFKLHQEVRDHAFNSIKKLDRYYEGIGRSDIILSYERTVNSLKSAEINIHVNKAILTAKEKSEDFILSIDRALEKIIRQLDKYKTKIRTKAKHMLRTLKERRSSSLMS